MENKNQPVVKYGGPVGNPPGEVTRPRGGHRAARAEREGTAMNRGVKKAWAWFLVLVLALPTTALGQGGGMSQPFKPEELEQLVAPIALYPDSLVAQAFMASTYPLEVVQAARWV